MLIKRFLYSKRFLQFYSQKEKNPRWMTDIIKSKLKERSNLAKQYYQNGKKILI